MMSCLTKRLEVAKMKVFNILGFVISILLAFVSYFATSNIFVGSGVLVGSVIFLFALLRKQVQNHISLTTKIHECYLFINNFLITLSIKGTLIAAFDATRTSISDEYFDYLSSIEELNPHEKLLYLSKYFPLHIYQIFTDIIFLWEEEGGDILQMSTHVSNEIREIQEYVSYCQSIGRRKAIEIGTLWLFSLAIVIILRLSFNSSFSDVLKHPIFIVSVCLLMVLVLLSLFLLVSRVSHLEVRRVQNV